MYMKKRYLIKIKNASRDTSQFYNISIDFEKLIEVEEISEKEDSRFFKTVILTNDTNEPLFIPKFSCKIICRDIENLNENQIKIKLLMYQMGYEI